MLRKSPSAIKVLGVDVSCDAVALARENIERNKKRGLIIPEDDRHQELNITRADIFSDRDMDKLAACHWDILVSNPPYISPSTWNYGHGQMGYSVRKYEPRLALVPGNHLPIPDGWEREDVFYSRLLDLASRLQPRLVLMEVGDEAQARRILCHFPQHPFASGATVEVWRDHPDLDPSEAEVAWLAITTATGDTWKAPVKGRGSVRSICIWKTAGSGEAVS
ncbi:hypothetical protein HIM_06395 [Hirsutella minnesotensis 3608]|uniref:Methyltransferase small domain-containing protein n=1 Tax=Hirsutella minnesotensis 3608 TaxID=1043627 RepID=A0A0F8A4U0_9HYPO|nr:hypothetical protein HIM_06395 [Hirsutella minnesotensis 3608]